MLGNEIASTVMSIVLAASLCPGAAFASELEAAHAVPQAASAVSLTSAVSTQGAKNLEKRGVKFDLEAGKAFDTKVYRNGYGNDAYTAKLSGLKVGDADEAGRKQAVFTVTFTDKKPLTKAEGNKVLDSFKKECETNMNAPSVVWEIFYTPLCYVHLVDYVTGENLLNPDNTAGVKIESEWSSGKPKKYKKGDWWFTDSKTLKCKVSVTYPEDYENLCVGVGGSLTNSAGFTKADASYTAASSYTKNGRVYYGFNRYGSKYWKTTFFKKGKSNTHFMRIR